MPNYYDEKTKTYYVKFYYTDWTGAKKQKLKRGFKLQREAKEWEREFLEKYSKTPDISFSALVEKYKDHIYPTLKESTKVAKENIIINYLLPYFKEKPVNQITPSDIVLWQNELISKPLSDGYKRLIYKQLTAIFHFAVDYCNLPSTPCKKSIKRTEPKKDMQIWTQEEFHTFIKAVEDPTYHLIFHLLYYTGMRVGECLALTPEDIDLESGVLTINKTYYRIPGKDTITPPKTAKSNRTIALPTFLCEEIKQYYSKIYGITSNTRLFPMYKETLGPKVSKYCTISGVKKIRIHDFRHSHASLLIELGFSPVLIANRLGHENISITLNTYSHLYPNKQSELISKLEDSYKLVSF